MVTATAHARLHTAFRLFRLFRPGSGSQSRHSFSPQMININTLLGFPPPPFGYRWHFHAHSRLLPAPPPPCALAAPQACHKQLLRERVYPRARREQRSPSLRHSQPPLQTFKFPSRTRSQMQPRKYLIERKNYLQRSDFSQPFRLRLRPWIFFSDSTPRREGKLFF